MPVPREAYNLMDALKDAESGAAQRRIVTAGTEIEDQVAEGLSNLELEEGEVLKLPPTPTQTDGHEGESDPETERITHRSWTLALPKALRHQARHSIDSVPPPPPPRRRVPPFSAGASPGSATPPPVPPRSHARARSISPPTGPLGYTAPYETRKEHVPSPLAPTDGFVHDALPLSPHGSMTSGSAASGSIASPSSIPPPPYEGMSEGERREWEQHEASLGTPASLIPPGQTPLLVPESGTPALLIPPVASPGLQIPLPELTEEEKENWEKQEKERKEREEEE